MKSYAKAQNPVLQCLLAVAGKLYLEKLNNGYDLPKRGCSIIEGLLCIQIIELTESVNEVNLPILLWKPCVSLWASNDHAMNLELHDDR